MKIMISAAVGIAIVCATTAFAQDAALGTYKGSFDVQTSGGMMAVGVNLTINSVDDGKVKGSATLGGRGCAGDYPLEGTLRGSDLAVRATRKGGVAGDCDFGFRGTVQGDRLVGKAGRFDLELRK
jgi:hypothetical protein